MRARNTTGTTATNPSLGLITNGTISRTGTLSSANLDDIFTFSLNNNTILDFTFNNSNYRVLIYDSLGNLVMQGNGADNWSDRTLKAGNYSLKLELINPSISVSYNFSVAFDSLAQYDFYSSLAPLTNTWFNNNKESIGGVDTTDLLLFSTQGDKFEFSIAIPHNKNIAIELLNENNQVIYRPYILPINQRPSNYIPTFTWDLPAGNYRIRLTSTDTVAFDYDFSLISQQEAISSNLLAVATGFTGRTDNIAHLPTVNPLYNRETTGYYKEFRNNPQSLQEIINTIASIKNEINVIERIQQFSFEVTEAEAGVKEVGIGQWGSNIQLTISKNGQVLYRPNLRNVQGFQNFTWDLTAGLYTVTVELLNTVPSSPFPVPPSYELAIIGNGNANNVSFSAETVNKTFNYGDIPLTIDSPILIPYIITDNTASLSYWLNNHRQEPSGYGNEENNIVTYTANNAVNAFWEGLDQQRDIDLFQFNDVIDRTVELQLHRWNDYENESVISDLIIRVWTENGSLLVTDTLLWNGADGKVAYTFNNPTDQDLYIGVSSTTYTTDYYEIGIYQGEQRLVNQVHDPTRELWTGNKTYALNGITSDNYANNSLTTAFNLLPNQDLSAINGYGFIDSPTIDDYYLISLDQHSIASFSLNFNHSNANLDLFLLDSNGDIIDSSESNWSNSEFISSPLTPGNYYLKVISYDGDNSIYDFSWGRDIVPIYSFSDASNLSNSPINPILSDDGNLGYYIINTNNNSLFNHALNSYSSLYSNPFDGDYYTYYDLDFDNNFSLKINGEGAIALINKNSNSSVITLTNLTNSTYNYNFGGGEYRLITATNSNFNIEVKEQNYLLPYNYPNNYILPPDTKLSDLNGQAEILGEQTENFIINISEPSNLILNSSLFNTFNLDGYPVYFNLFNQDNIIIDSFNYNWTNTIPNQWNNTQKIFSNLLPGQYKLSIYSWLINSYADFSYSLNNNVNSTIIDLKDNYDNNLSSKAFDLTNYIGSTLTDINGFDYYEKQLDTYENNTHYGYFYKFSLTEPTTVSFLFDPATYHNSFYVQLTGNGVNTSIDIDNFVNDIYSRSLNAGTYTLRVTNNSSQISMENFATTFNLGIATTQRPFGYVPPTTQPEPEQPPPSEPDPLTNPYNNYSFATAVNLSSTINGVAPSTSEQFFKFYSEYMNVDLNLQFSHATANLDLTLYNSSGAIISESNSLTNNEFISDFLNGNYYIGVKNLSNSPNSFTLSLDAYD